MRWCDPLGGNKVPKTATTEKCPLVTKASENAAEQPVQPLLSRLDCAAAVIMSEADDPERCTQAADAMKCIASLTESVAEMGSQYRAEKDGLQAQVAFLQRRLMWRTAALEILLLGVASIAAVIWITHWWPWR
jgi:hypothetical protein